MKVATICLLCKEQKLLLGIKKKGFGIGKMVLPGGHIEGLEGVKASAKREIFEETGIKIEEDALRQVAKINFYFNDEHVFECHVVLAKDFAGEARDSDEIGDFKLYQFDKLPFDKMLVDDHLWIPLILRDGKEIDAIVNFNFDGSEVKSFSYKEVKFS